MYWVTASPLFCFAILKPERISIVDPKAKRLLKDLADMNLIKILTSINPKVEFKALLLKLRSKADSTPSLEEITQEVESVRALRYASKTK